MFLRDLHVLRGRQNLKLISFEIDQPVLFHSAQLGGHGAAVNAQIIRQHLPVIGDGKPA